ncbi:MAG TPA: hypothetical protein V6D19_05575 [Stenomitos sp.]
MKKVALSLLTIAALGSTFVAPLGAKAVEVNLGRDFNISVGERDSSYDVFFKRNRFSGWQYYGGYNSSYKAQAIVFSLQAQGFRAYYAQR